MTFTFRFRAKPNGLFTHGKTQGFLNPHPWPTLRCCKSGLIAQIYSGPRDSQNIFQGLQQKWPGQIVLLLSSALPQRKH